MINTVINGDALEVLKTLPDRSVNCCVTSPPYWGLRDYGVSGQLGLERTPEEYVTRMVEIFREVKRVLKDDGTLWLNLGDSYASGGTKSNNNGSGKSTLNCLKSGYVPPYHRQDVGAKVKQDIPLGFKPKDLVGIPWRVAFALQADGWYLRSDIIWSKPNPMPESVRDRPTKAHEYVFLLAKSARYYYDADAIREPAKGASISRLSQDIENQTGSTRGNGGLKTNGNMKAVRFGGNRADVYGVRTKSGKEWDPKHGGSGTGFEGHSGNTLADGTTLITANKKSVWHIATAPYSGAHFATYPPALVEPCIKAGCPESGIVLDPFMGSGTVAQVATLHRRNWIGIELNPAYCELVEKRRKVTPMMF